MESEGNRLAGQLLANRLESLGLEPLEGQTGFLLPFDQTVRIPGETSLTAIMEDRSRAELAFGRDYMFTGSSTQIDGTVPVSSGGDTDPSAVMFIDLAAEGELPSPGAFATLVYMYDELRFSSLGVIDYGVHAGTPRAFMPYSVYDGISEAAALEIRYAFEDITAPIDNVAGVLPGEDRTRAVVLSAHSDGIGDQAGNRLPGALDNASGVIVLDRVLDRLASAGERPPYDVIVAYTNAEECGFTGAHDIVGAEYCGLVKR